MIPLSPVAYFPWLLSVATTLAPNKHFFSNARLFLLTDFPKTFIYRKISRFNIGFDWIFGDYWQDTLSRRVF